jgi:hypothetical protein
MIDRLKALWMRLPGWGQQLSVRILLSSLLLTLVSQVATYFYAMRYGARIPLEGVPFLAVMAIVASVGLATISFAALIFVPLAKNFDQSSSQLMRLLVRLNFVSSDNDGSSHPISRYALLAFLVYSVLHQSAHLLEHYTSFDTGAHWYLGFLMVLESTAETSSWTVVFHWMQLAVYAFFLIALLGVLRIRAMQIASWVIYFGAILTLTAAMMGPSFDQLLRISRFGGGIGVNLLMAEKAEVRTGHLFLISSDTLTLWDPKTLSFHEVNRKHIDRLTYRQQPYWRMPESRA